MSKSLGNIVLVRDLLAQAPGEAIRLALLSAHYRQPLDWSDEVLIEAQRKLDRLYGALRDTEGWRQGWQAAGPHPDFTAALEDDLNTPRALAVLFDTAREINRDRVAAAESGLAARMRAGAELLGLLNSAPEQWFKAEVAGQLSAEEIEQRLAERGAARSRKDFAAADRIREELADAGVMIEDGPDGTRWRRG